jgi:hypothetical protein
VSERESLFALGEVRREREIPDDIEVALYRNAPQALLRDLHRPVSAFSLTPFDFVHEQKIRADAGGQVTAENRKTLLASYRVPIDELLHTNADMRAEYRALKEVIARPWVDAPDLKWMRARG